MEIKSFSACRFIPSRDSMKLDSSNFSILGDISTSKANSYNSFLAESINGGVIPSGRILSFKEKNSSGAKILALKQKPPATVIKHTSKLDSLYTQNKRPNPTKKSGDRFIASKAARIHDAPGIKDDFYLHLLDWSRNDHVAVALGSTLYLWDICTGSIDLLFKVNDESITSLRWSGEGSRIAVGTTDNAVSIWDLDTKKKLRTMNGHSARVGSLAWNNHILSSGSRDTMIFHHDVRIRDHIQQTLSAHQGEICGLEWSSDGQLASGGNDNKCYVWDASSSIPKHTFSDSVAAVRALAWCPFRKDLLATGSGQSDKHIRFYDSCSGHMLRSVDTGSQVSSLIWGQHGDELVSSHGYSQNQLSVWQYPSLKKITDLTGHTSRVLHMTPSPDGTTVCSAGADETLRFWKIWELQKSKKKAKVSLRTCKNIR